MLIRADARQIPLVDGCVQTCVTSPPYWSLRDYGVTNQIGLESSPDAYVAALVAVFREVRRVLKDDGTVWLNLGDSYHSGDRGGYRNDSCDGCFLLTQYDAQAAQIQHLQEESGKLKQQVKDRQQWLDDYVLETFDRFLRNGQSGEDATDILKDLGLNELLRSRR